MYEGEATLSYGGNLGVICEAVDAVEGDMNDDGLLRKLVEVGY